MSAFAEQLLTTYAADRTRLLDMLWDVQRRARLPARRRAGAAGSRPGHDPARRPRDGVVLPLLPRAARRATPDLPRRHRPGADARLRPRCSPRSSARPVPRWAESTRPGPSACSRTPCIGLSDQEPAMLVDDVAFTRLRPGQGGRHVGRCDPCRRARQQRLANPAGLPRGHRRSTSRRWSSPTSAPPARCSSGSTPTCTTCSRTCLRAHPRRSSSRSPSPTCAGAAAPASPPA